MPREMQIHSLTTVGASTGSEDTKMAHATELSGPDFSVGIPLSDLIENVPVLGHVQGDKVIAFKMKRRKGFRKKHGHRTHYTKIKISGIA